MIYFSYSPLETQLVASQIVKKFIDSKNKYLFLYLVGELGSGKTEFVRGVAKKLGFSDKKVKSPSFVYITEFENKKYKLLHLDFYRINKKFVNRIVHDLLEETISEHLSQRLVICFEWAEKISKNVKNLVRNIKEAKSVNVKIITVGEKKRKIVVNYD